MRKKGRSGEERRERRKGVVDKIDVVRGGERETGGTGGRRYWLRKKMINKVDMYLNLFIFSGEREGEKTSKNEHAVKMLTLTKEP